MKYDEMQALIQDQMHQLAHRREALQQELIVTDNAIQRLIGKLDLVQAIMRERPRRGKENHASEST